MRSKSCGSKEAICPKGRLFDLILYYIQSILVRATSFAKSDGARKTKKVSQNFILNASAEQCHCKWALKPCDISIYYLPCWLYLLPSAHIPCAYEKWRRQLRTPRQSLAINLLNIALELRPIGPRIDAMNNNHFCLTYHNYLWNVRVFYALVHGRSD